MREDLYKKAIDHLVEHNCSAHPYEDGQRLVETIRKYSAKNILEIGTGIGYTAALMALISGDIKVTTLEKDTEHFHAAEEFISNLRLENQVTILNKQAEFYLSEISDSYDLIFFDGFQIHYEFLPHYERLLKDDGILFLANNHLKSKTSDKFFKELANKGKWHVLERFRETTISAKVRLTS